MNSISIMCPSGTLMGMGNGRSHVGGNGLHEPTSSLYIKRQVIINGYDTNFLCFQFCPCIYIIF